VSRRAATAEGGGLVRRIQLAPFDLITWLGPVLAVMDAAYGLDDSGSRQRARIVRRHAARAGLIAHGAFADDDLVGFCYGFPSDDEGWWEQQIRPRMQAAGTAHWLDGRAFALTELHVHPDHHRRGIGRCLITGVLAMTDLPKALLSVRTGARPARRLYASLGFTDLTSPFHFGPGQQAYTVMGSTLTPTRGQPARQAACTDHPDLRQPVGLSRSGAPPTAGRAAAASRRCRPPGAR
jgi:ribosomal protein S18 acetylase RimI-like enzyme